MNNIDNTKPYTPTSIEVQNLKRNPEHFKLSGDGIFASLQGEGVTAGEPAVFMRLQFCNLSCGLNDGWQCDTAYTWDKRLQEYWQEPYDLNPQDAFAAIEAAWSEKFGSFRVDPRLVITGGEPLLQQKTITELLSYCDGWKVEIETNGTIMPRDELSSCQFNCSPKLGNSGNALAKRYKPEVLEHIASLEDSWFKFVASSVADLREVDSVAHDCSIPQSKILIMPEGQTVSDMYVHSQAIEDAVETKGWRLTLRNQLIWFGNERMT